MDNATLITIRRIGALVLAAAAVVVVLTAGPDSPDEAQDTNYARLLDAARSEYDANNSRTSGAPQQQVVNGWFARDALTIQVLQLSDLLDRTEPQATDPRLPLLGLFAVLAICLYAATSPTVHRAGTKPDSVTSGEPDEPGAADAVGSPPAAAGTGAASAPGATPPPPGGPPQAPPPSPPGSPAL